MKRRIAKKLGQLRQEYSKGGQIPAPPDCDSITTSLVTDDRPVPSPPASGELLVEDGYVGWILITTPHGRQKVRWLSEAGVVFRDSRCWRGGRFTVKRHAAFCRVEPCTVQPVVADVDDQAVGR